MSYTSIKPQRGFTLNIKLTFLGAAGNVTGSKFLVETKNTRFLVAEIDGIPAGAVVSTHDSRKGWINRLGVLERFRGRGVGKALVSECEKWLMGQGIGIFACIIEGWNRSSMDAFEAMGYREFEDARYFTKRMDPEI